MYTITLNDTQVKTLVDALDTYSRLLTGQLTELSKLNTNLPFQTYGQTRAVLKAALILKAAMFPELGEYTSYGITGDKVPEKAKILYDIMCTLQHKRAWTNKPEGGITVDFDEPLHVSKEPLPIVEIKKEKINDYVACVFYFDS